jgi:hypothetical protein
MAKDERSEQDDEQRSASSEEDAKESKSRSRGRKGSASQRQSSVARDKASQEEQSDQQGDDAPDAEDQDAADQGDEPSSEEQGTEEQDDPAGGGGAEGDGDAARSRKGKGGGGEHRRKAPKKPKGLQLINHARQLFMAASGRRPETITGMRKEEDGWVISMDVVELARIPSSSDVMGEYHVRLDDDGDFLGYERVSRYIRSQPSAREQG